MGNVLDIRAWVRANESKIFRYSIYKRIFTPYEQKMAYMDESEFTSTHYKFAKIHEAIDLGSGNWLIGFWVNFDDEENPDKIIEYHKLEDIKLSYFEYDDNFSGDYEPEM